MTTSTAIMILAVLWFLVLPTLRDRVFSANRLVLTPIVFTWLLFNNIHKFFHLNIGGQLVIALAVVIGAGLGILSFKNIVVRADHKHQLIGMKGSFKGLAVFLIIFTAEFVFHTLMAMYPSILHPSLGQYAVLLMLCSATCMSIGSNGLLYVKYHRSESQDLSSERTTRRVTKVAPKT